MSGTTLSVHGPAQPVLSPPRCVPEDECVTTDSITLTWTVAGTVAGFELQWGSVAGIWPAANAVTLDGQARTWTHDGLRPDQTRFYRIRAVGTQGIMSNWSRVVSATTLSAHRPAQPVLSPPRCVPEDECVTTDSITLTWTVAGTVAGFELQWGSVAGVWPAANTVTLDGPARTWTHDGLRPDQTRFYRIRAVGTQGIMSNWSRGGERHHPLGAQTGPAGALSPPRCVPEDECVTTDSITLTWTVAGTVAGFELQWSSEAGIWPEANAVTLHGQARTWTHDGLRPDQTRFYRIRAVGTQGIMSNWSRVVSATTLSAHRPAQPVLSPPRCVPEDECVTSDSITLTWTVAGTVASFELQYRSAGASWPPAGTILRRAGENLDPQRSSARARPGSTASARSTCKASRASGLGWCAPPPRRPRAVSGPLRIGVAGYPDTLEFPVDQVTRRALPTVSGGTPPYVLSLSGCPDWIQHSGGDLLAYPPSTAPGAPVPCTFSVRDSATPAPATASHGFFVRAAHPEPTAFYFEPRHVQERNLPVKQLNRPHRPPSLP